MRLSTDERNAVRFISKYNLLLIPDNLRHAYCGLHSGMPECCILHFIVYWLPLTELLPIFETNLLTDEIIEEALKERPVRYKTKLAQVLNWHHPNRSNYVRCPKCRIEDYAVEIKSCRCGTDKKNHFRPDFEAIIQQITTKSGKIKKVYQHDYRR